MSIIGLLAPIGTGLATNTSPSLTPVNAAIGVDSTQAGILYIANGTTWNPIADNLTADATITATTLTSAGSNPALTATIYLKSIVGPSFTNVFFEMDINSSITAIVPDTWTSTVGVVTSAFRPATTCVFPLYCTVNGAYETGNSKLQISSAGTVSVIVNFSYTSTSVAFTNCNGVYKH